MGSTIRVPVLGLYCVLSLSACGGEAPAAEATDAVEATEATAAAPAAETAPAKAEAPAAEPTPAAQAPDIGFMGKPEIQRRLYMQMASITTIRKGRGGRSLSFKVTFEDGSHAYFKPEQSFSGANWYAEVAAYYIDRALGLGGVPAVVARSIEWRRLKNNAKGDKRLAEVKVGDDKRVRGALVDWIEEDLGHAKTPPGWESWVRVTNYPAQGTSPFQRPALYTAALDRARARRTNGKAQETYYTSVPKPGRPELPAELSDLLVLDYLTHNIDRWGGDNVNLLTLGKRGPVIFLDNGAGFFHGPDRQGLMEDRLKVQQCFRRSTVDALEKLDVAALGKKMATDPLGPFLDAKLLAGLEVRRRALLERATEMMRTHGEDAVLKW